MLSLSIIIVHQFEGRIYNKFVHLKIPQLLDAFYFQIKNATAWVSLLQKASCSKFIDFTYVRVYENVPSIYSGI
ncbi:MAG: hypothetical protein Mars2KO_03080 [Maribacter sp.]